MRNIAFLVLLQLSSVCCMQRADENSSDIARKELADSLHGVFDSLMSININIPQKIDSNLISIECLKEFNKLAIETEGRLSVVVNSDELSNKIIEVININTSDSADILFLIDKTKSMTDDLEDLKIGINDILSSIEKYHNIRISIATYGDKQVRSRPWYSFKNFENDIPEIKSFILDIETWYSIDIPESVYDGFFETTKENFWKSKSKRMVILLGDAPSHNHTKSEHSLQEVIAYSNKENIKMNFYPFIHLS